MKIKEVTNLIKGQLLQGNYDDEINVIEQDTRLIQNGDTFIAFKGANFDGNEYISNAIENGASNIITNLPNVKVVGDYNCNIIYTPDSLYALHEIIKYKMANIDTKIIAVTGSVGKTSTRELIGEVLSNNFTIFKNEKNYNGMRGLPLTCSKISNEDVAILEMGMDGLNQISVLSKMVRPYISIITNIGSSHIGKLGSKENILKAKLEIIEGTRENGFLILNIDDEMLKTVEENFSTYNTKNLNLITFGIKNPSAMFNVTKVRRLTNSTKFTVEIGKELSLDFEINSVGDHNIYNALTSIICGKIFNISAEDIQKSLLGLKSTERRFQKINFNNFTLYDDSYNASFESVSAAIESLTRKKLKGRMIYILGDIFELGEYTEFYHRKIGEKLLKANFDILVTIGENSFYINEELLDNNKNVEHLHFKNVDDFLEHFIEIKENDSILLKASNGMKFNKITEFLKEKFNLI